jgi:transposase
MAQLFWLSERAWAALERHLPRGKPGRPRVDDRRVISGILHVMKTGCRWRDVPAGYGPPTTVHNRYNRWSQRGVWARLFERAAAAGEVYSKCGGKPSGLARKLNSLGSMFTSGSSLRRPTASAPLHVRPERLH